MTSSLARYLTDFTAPPRPSGRPAADSGAHVEDIAAAPAPAAVDIEAERALAREEGRRQGRQAAQAEHAESMALIEAEHSDALGSLEQRYQVDLATRLAERLVEMRDEIALNIGREAARAIAPFVERAVAHSMCEKLAAAICEMIGREKGVRLTVHGPAYLFGYLEALPAMAALELNHVEADEPDLGIEIDDSVLATRMKAFAASLAEVFP